MRFLKENIADWIIEYLKENGPSLDAELHWIACNTFMTRDEMLGGNNSLGKFSRNYSHALNALTEKNYVFHTENDLVKTHRELEKLNPRDLVFEKDYIKKIRCFYIVEFEHGCKIGMTVNMKNRVRVYGSPWCKKIKTIQIVEHNAAESIEDHLKVCFKENAVGGATEFFDVKKELIHKEILAAYPEANIVDYAI